jgi:hypothetical protein
MILLSFEKTFDWLGGNGNIWLTTRTQPSQARSNR